MSEQQMQSAKLAADALLHQHPTLVELLADIQVIDDRETRREAVEDVLRGLATLPATAEAARRAGVSKKQMLVALCQHSLVRIGNAKIAETFARTVIQKPCE